MPDYSQRFEENVPGSYYVDRTCVHCKLCMDIAPDHFNQNDENVGFVHAQPFDEASLRLCQKAKEHCPVSAIGDDGSAGLETEAARVQSVNLTYAGVGGISASLPENDWGR
ncbi:MAG: ferredoxin [Verrucomicrobiae bacterium]|nr:ferredoxin [Verrucomicrobiae bacterium]